MTPRQKIRFNRLFEFYEEKSREQEELCEGPLFIFPKPENKERHSELQRELMEISRQMTRC